MDWSVTFLKKSFLSFKKSFLAEPMQENLGEETSFKQIEE